MKPKTPITSAALVKELRTIARELTRASKSDTLDHAKVCDDTAQSIRDWLKTIEVKPVEIALIVEGGLIQDALCTHKDVSVEVCDLDCHDDPEQDEADNLRADELFERRDKGELYSLPT